MRKISGKEFPNNVYQVSPKLHKLQVLSTKTKRTRRCTRPERRKSTGHHIFSNLGQLWNLNRRRDHKWCHLVRMLGHEKSNYLLLREGQIGRRHDGTSGLREVAICD
jgi:hypothetical protein